MSDIYALRMTTKDNVRAQGFTKDKLIITVNKDDTHSYTATISYIDEFEEHLTIEDGWGVTPRKALEALMINSSPGNHGVRGYRWAYCGDIDQVVGAERGE